MNARADRLPQAANLYDYIQPGDFMDCASVILPHKEASIDQLARLFAKTPPKWVQVLLGMRNFLMKPLGLRTEFEGDQSMKNECKAGELIGFFRIYYRDDNEILMGDDDKHLDYRVSVFRDPNQPEKLYAATWVHRHNWLGYAYLFAILPFHKIIVKAMLTRGAKALEKAPV